LVVPLADGFFHALLFVVHFVEDTLDCEDGGGFDIVYFVVVPESEIGLLVEGHTVIVNGLNQRAYHDEI
jgi:hypothetical protein